ncbi:HD domain-containing phosphohydrolase [Heliorestis convoluta]|uniref:Stage 0 sporulation protein A homolog n=1 Tax=Heliorestis convoluta TaxID=356322 RepID=A0A5Q2N4Q2_9FIRM|nr:HD domain-containing phosphohydrolase [Heliorestis convoluta]QGG48292.1 response regulator [Heliorestis convoluta]
MTEKPKVLLVDDEENVLFALKRQLRNRFQVLTADGGKAGIQAIETAGPFDVVVADYRMPGMDGIEFLAYCHKNHPDTSRIMLTGHADMQVSIDAVNEGKIFRFLTKPCPPEIFIKSLEGAIEQYRLVTAERELLDKTLKGSIKVLVDILSLSNSKTFQLSGSIRKLARELAQTLAVPHDRIWEVELAALFSQIGCVTIPAHIMQKKEQGLPLDNIEKALFDEHPLAGRRLLTHIPRLENVAEAVAFQQKRFDGQGVPTLDLRSGPTIPLLGRILKVILDFDELLRAGKGLNSALDLMRSRSGWYDPAILKALVTTVLGNQEGYSQYTEGDSLLIDVMVDDLMPGMILAEELVDIHGRMLIPKGFEVTDALKMRIRNFARFQKIKEPIKVLDFLRG